MKTMLMVVLSLGILISPFQQAFAGYVNGYMKSNGTYVNGYYRSNPDGNPYNNYSYPGNTNPYTGVTAGGSTDSYLRSYYDSSSYSAPTYKSNTDCPSYGFAYLGDCYELPDNAKKSIFSGFDCNYGYEGVGYGLTKKCLPKIDNGYRIGTSIYCNYGYELYSNSCLKKANNSAYTASVANYNFSDLSCPKNSSESKTDSSKCSCNLGYDINSDKDGCKKISKTTNDKLCRADFGKNSQWTGEYDIETENPYCGCKKKYEWNSDQTSCIKE